MPDQPAKTDHSAEDGKEKEVSQQKDDDNEEETIDTSFPARDGPQIAKAPSN